MTAIAIIIIIPWHHHTHQTTINQSQLRYRTLLEVSQH
jgi:hypothetical protein